jgi:hypothetical protein
VILTFPKLQRLSGLTKPTAVKAWLKREGVSYIKDAKGQPFTTLDALNRKLQRAADDGFTLEDPEGGLPEERPVVSGRPKPLDRAHQGGRRAARSPSSPTGNTYRAASGHSGRTTSGVFTASGDHGHNKAGI